MWVCQVCDATVDDDSWQRCWQCAADRDVSGAELDHQRSVIERKRSPDNPMLCLRCQVPMNYTGTKRFHEGTRQWGFWLGDLGELFVNREAYDVYACRLCGKLEFFLDGVGEDLRDERS